ncbi:MAG TPA: PhoH family protein [Acholeplasmataceae bacterium]|jgi:phosphate starvation-inducible PhoH-like protein|nr:PhoH family protein [Acholeplasmataceae bacterium]
MGYKTIYSFKNIINEALVLGPNNRHIDLIESFYKEEILVRNAEVKIPENSDKENILVMLFEVLETIFENDIALTEVDILGIMNNLTVENGDVIIKLFLKKEILITTFQGKAVFPRTLNQKLYLEALTNNDIVFAIGPAGTGKTYLGVLYALSRLKAGEAKRIVLVRPVVEAGEKLGYLPGDVKDKIDPYLIPLYDSLNEALGKEAVDKLIEKGAIEIAPLAYMRGRTIEKAVIILDEAQNTSRLQMKMFLTRLGHNSKMIITGDVTQIDLPSRDQSGLLEAVKLFTDIDRIKICRFSRYDVMRHPLVQKIIERYEGRHGNQSL